MVLTHTIKWVRRALKGEGFMITVTYREKDMLYHEHHACNFLIKDIDTSFGKLSEDIRCNADIKKGPSRQQGEHHDKERNTPSE